MYIFSLDITGVLFVCVSKLFYVAIELHQHGADLLVFKKFVM